MVMDIASQNINFLKLKQIKKKIEKMEGDFE